MNKTFCGCLLAALPFLSSSPTSAEEHLLSPHFIVTFEGEVGHDVSRTGTARIGADTRADGAPVRTVMKFALPQGIDPAAIERAKLSIVTNETGVRNDGALQFSVFAYGGDDTLAAGEGLGGTRVAGPFEYVYWTRTTPDLSRIDVLASVRTAITQGHTHIGFALRAVNAEPDYHSDEQYIHSATKGDTDARPPLLVIHLSGSAPATAPEASAQP